MKIYANRYKGKATRRIYNKKIYKRKVKNIKFTNEIRWVKPSKTLTRGYGIITLNGKTIKSVKNLNKEDEINIKLYDGTVNAKILSKECD